jgi:hypothetical protein
MAAKEKQHISFKGVVRWLTPDFSKERKEVKDNGMISSMCVGEGNNLEFHTSENTKMKIWK